MLAVLNVQLASYKDPSLTQPYQVTICRYEHFRPPMDDATLQFKPLTKRKSIEAE